MLPSATAPTPPPRGTLDCNSIGNEVPTRQRIVLNAVALPDPSATPVLQAIRESHTSGSGLTYFAKDGLGFKVGTQWRLTVPREARPHLRIGWGSPARPGFVVQPPRRCPIPPDAEWLWYPGGYWTDKPGCYPVVVQVGARHQRVSVPIGASCV